MPTPPSNADEAMALVREAIKSITGRRDDANWHHGHVNGMISAFSLMGLFEKTHIRAMNVAADDALELITHASLPKQDI
ncbi:hypothetical protein NJC08_08400 [Pseudomonas fluorescens]|uniref:hypothetical protein n=1 Tax=Pseudomonas fluorescens TaxID=294 RepID=UPI00209BB10D|nr:hypothetical protein [Pseudomonas fluorescens]MCO7626431.1 hypothetical protein [Pseudomonas fluorescens]